MIYIAEIEIRFFSFSSKISLERNDIYGGYHLVLCFYVTINSYVYNNYHWLRRNGRYIFPLTQKMIWNMYVRKVWRYARCVQKS